MHDSDTAPRVKYHTSETGVWYEVRTSNISFAILKDSTIVLVLSGSIYHLSRQATEVSTNIG